MGREMSYARLQVDVHQLILDLRSIENTTEKLFFQRLWQASDEDERKKIKRIILCGDKDTLMIWMENHPDVDLGELSYNKLKKLGQRLRIRNYCRLERHELEDAIRERRQS